MRKQTTSVSHQKRYGQYFSGQKVADLLSALLPSGKTYRSVVDPMAGIGDLLLAISARLQSNSSVIGVEIDAPVAKQCSMRIPAARVLNADAFCSRDLITCNGWDMVITNPPYVRYQLQSDAHDVMPSKNDLRNNLCKQIDGLLHLSEEDKLLFKTLAKHYSGLADMAVPAWILCSALVAYNGTLAVVVPESWLSREYASPIQYMLLKCFDNITIARDVNACWFENALVRTCLVVAERKSTVSLGAGIHKKILQIDLERNLVGERSLVEKLEYKKLTNYDALASLVSEGKRLSGNGYKMDVYEADLFFSDLLKNAKAAKWSSAEDQRNLCLTTRLPAEMYKVIGEDYIFDFVSLQDLGLMCGQGLRTGANDFFYLNLVQEEDLNYTVQSRPWCADPKEFRIGKNEATKAITNRRDIKGLVASPAELGTVALVISDGIRVDDDCTYSNASSAKKYFLSENLTKYITTAEKYTDSRGTHFKERSAVSPNERRDDSGYLRLWYMLPPLARRHLPDLCMTRINAGATECLFIPQKKDDSISVDANFSTLWGEEEQSAYLGLALLNSSWSKCALELICTIMGGGALKVEATHLRKLLFPRYSQDQLDALVVCGVKLVTEKSMNPQLRDEIDRIVLAPFGDGFSVLESIRSLLKKKLVERGARCD